MATISEFILNGIPDFTYNVLLLIISAIFVLRVDWVLGLFILVTIPVYFIVYKKLEDKMYENEEEYKEAGNNYTAKGMEQIRCTRFVKENAVSKEMEERFQVAFERMLRGAIGQVKTQYLFSNLNRLIMIFCYLLVLGIGGYNVVIGKISIGYFTIINSYVTMILSASSDIIEFSGNYPKVKVSIDRMNQLLCDCDVEKDNNVELQSFDEKEIECITLDNLSFSFEKKLLFKELSVEFKKGNIYGIVGDNGVGKSTLLDIIIGLYPNEYEGKILYNGIDLKTIDSEELRKNRIAFLGQQIERINSSPQQYLHFGIKNFDIEKEKEWIQYFLLDKESDINNVENIVHCSGGEMQKLTLIRTFQKNCCLTILDEPTNGLDIETVQKLVTLLKNEKEHHIFIIVSHDKRILDICDETIEL